MTRYADLDHKLEATLDELEAAENAVAALRAKVRELRERIGMQGNIGGYSRYQGALI